MPSAVILRKDVRLDVPSVAPHLAEALKITIHDARLIVRKSRGIFQEWLDDARAQATAAALAKLGIDAAVIPQAAIPKAPVMRRIFSGKLDPDGFDMVINPIRKPIRIAWKQVDFISIGVVATPQYEEFITSQAFKTLPPIYQIEDEEAKADLRRKLASRALRRDQHETTSLKGRPRLDRRDLDALYRDQTVGFIELWTYGSPVRYRLNRHDFNYEYLGTRSRRTSMENFRITVGDIHGRTPKALYTKISKDFLLGAELHEILFDSTEEFDRYSRWFLHQAAGATPQPGVLAPGVSEGLLGPDVPAMVDEVESLE